MKITWLSANKIKKLLYIICAFWKYKWLRCGRGILYLWHLLGWKPYLIIGKKCRKNTWYLRRGRVLGVVHFWHLFSKSACYYRRILREQIDFRWQKISGGGDQNHSSLSAKKLSKKWLILAARFGGCALSPVINYLLRGGGGNYRPKSRELYIIIGKNY